MTPIGRPARALAAASAMGLAACGSAPPASDMPIVDLAFLADGVTTSEMCRQRLGTPSLEVAGAAGRSVSTFRVVQDGRGMHVLGKDEAWYRFDDAFSLVLSFDGRGVLERHALVRVKGR